jgi:hypothetical protein
VQGPYPEKGYTCQTCHMPEVVRPVAVGGPVREGHRHLWRGGHDPDMIKRAVSVEVVANPPEFKFGERVTFNLMFKNSGAGHKIPTGDPDRYFTISFTVRDPQGKVVSSQSHTIGRWILWKPVILELYDNRISPEQARNYSFSARIPHERNPQTLNIQVKYHILTEKAYKKLMTRYDLVQEVPHVFTIYEREIPLNENTKILRAELNGAMGDLQRCSS